MSIAEKDVAYFTIGNGTICLRPAVLAYGPNYLVSMSTGWRALFERGGDALREEVGQQVVAEATAEMSGGTQSVAESLTVITNEAEYAYYDAVQSAHKRIRLSGSRHFGLWWTCP